MNIDRIKEIQEETICPESKSIQQALLQVWNECAQDEKPVDCNECSEPKEFSSPMHVCSYCVNNPHFENNFKPKTKEWYEKPLSFPVICWVNDDNNSKDTVALITSFLKTECLFIESSENTWMYATPLTKEEVLNYCAGEK